MITGRLFGDWETGAKEYHGGPHLQATRDISLTSVDGTHSSDLTVRLAGAPAHATDCPVGRMACPTVLRPGVADLAQARPYFDLDLTGNNSLPPREGRHVIRPDTP